MRKLLVALMIVTIIVSTAVVAADPRKEFEKNPTSANYQKLSTPTSADYQKLSNPTSADYQKLSNPTSADFQKLASPTTADFKKLSKPSNSDYTSFRDKSKEAFKDYMANDQKANFQTDPVAKKAAGEYLNKYLSSKDPKKAVADKNDKIIASKYCAATAGANCGVDGAADVGFNGNKMTIGPTGGKTTTLDISQKGLKDATILATADGMAIRGATAAYAVDTPSGRFTCKGVQSATTTFTPNSVSVIGGSTNIVHSINGYTKESYDIWSGGNAAINFNDKGQLAGIEGKSWRVNDIDLALGLYHSEFSESFLESNSETPGSLKVDYTKGAPRASVTRAEGKLQTQDGSEIFVDVDEHPALLIAGTKGFEIGVFTNPPAKDGSDALGPLTEGMRRIRGLGPTAVQFSGSDLSPKAMSALVTLAQTEVASNNLGLDKNIKIAGGGIFGEKGTVGISGSAIGGVNVDGNPVSVKLNGGDGKTTLDPTKAVSATVDPRLRTTEDFGQKEKSAVNVNVPKDAPTGQIGTVTVNNDGKTYTLVNDPKNPNAAKTGPVRLIDEAESKGAEGQKPTTKTQPIGAEFTATGSDGKKYTLVAEPGETTVASTPATPAKTPADADKKVEVNKDVKEMPTPNPYLISATEFNMRITSIIDAAKTADVSGNPTTKTITVGGKPYVFENSESYNQAWNAVQKVKQPETKK
jgi:hypothetical protein